MAIKQYPHCDSRILHAPGVCEYCDRHPDWQELRRMWNINFTGLNEPGKEPCPADKARGKNHEGWYGNQAKTEKDEL